MTGKFGLRILAIFLACAASSSKANAFSLSDHTLITTQAVNEFNECAPNAFSNEDLQLLDQADLMEDLNFLRKWTQYSHYFRPFETLDMFWRSDSSARVADLNGAPFSLEVIGGILHYLQDAASPPHVVPVTHGLTDGFESYEVSDSSLLAASKGNENCGKLLHASINHNSVPSLLSEAGVGTLNLLSKFAIHAKSVTAQKVLVASDFWQESSLDASTRIRPFGHYGEMGNSYGESEVIMDGISYHVSTKEYDRNKVAYLRLGVEVSKKLLSYAWANRATVRMGNALPQ